MNENKTLENQIIQFENKMSNYFAHVTETVSKLLFTDFSFKIRNTVNADLEMWEKIISELPIQDGWVVYIKSDSEGSIGIVLLFSDSTAKNLIKQIAGNEIEDLSIQRSTLAELGNIIVGSFITKIPSHSLPSVPALTIDSFRGALELPIFEFADKSNSQIVIESELTNKDERIIMLVITEPSQVNKILSEE